MATFVLVHGLFGFNALKVGGFMHMPTGTPHAAWFSEDTIIQVHGLGPQGLTYVNPADDPRKGNEGRAAKPEAEGTGRTRGRANATLGTHTV